MMPRPVWLRLTSLFSLPDDAAEVDGTICAAIGPILRADRRRRKDCDRRLRLQVSWPVRSADVIALLRFLGLSTASPDRPGLRPALFPGHAVGATVGRRDSDALGGSRCTRCCD